MKFMLIMLLLSSTLHAQTLHMSVLGGGGEPHKDHRGKPVETTIFDEPLTALGKFSQEAGSETKVAFDGGHDVTETIAQNQFGTKTPFTAQEYLKIIEDYKKKINSGEIKSGDKLLINLLSHGAVKSPNELTHQIATNGVVTDFNKLSGTSTVSLDGLKSLVELAKKKGVKLGIVDYSCHSGNTLALADENTCVISATGPDHYAGAGTLSFMTLFASGMKKGKSLEDVFLEARSKFNDTSFPMISSPAGKEVQEKLYTPMTPYLYYHNPNSDKFIPFMEQKVLAGEDSCNLDEGLNSIVSEIAKVSSYNSQLPLQNFQNALSEYHQYLNDLKQKMVTHGLGEMGKKHKLCSGKECVTYTSKEIALGKYENLIRFYESQDPKAYKDQISIAKQALAIQAKLRTSSPQLAESARFWSSIPDLQRQTSILQSNVGKHQKALYQSMYERSEAKGPNPCKDFKL